LLLHKARNSSAPNIGGIVFTSFLTLNLESIIT
jgi:hypothetical protein